MEEKKITYSVTYHKQLSEMYKKDTYILWKDIESKNGGNVVAIYKGSRADCYKKLKEIKNGII